MVSSVDRIASAFVTDIGNLAKTTTSLITRSTLVMQLGNIFISQDLIGIEREATRPGKMTNVLPTAAERLGACVAAPQIA